MRKLRYAGAVIAGGILLFGASPAQAEDLLPGADTAGQQADQRLADVLGQSDGINLQNPLRYSSLKDAPVARNPIMQFQAGQNSPDVRPLLPGESAEAGTEPRTQPPAADVIGGALPRTRGSSADPRPIGQLPIGQLPIRNLPLSGLLGGGLPLLGGLNPDGRVPSAAQRPTVRQAEAFEGGVPLLGGLGGLPPVNDLPDADGSDRAEHPDLAGLAAGLPAGGMAVFPAGQPSSGRPPAGQPSSGQSSPDQSTPGQSTPDQSTPDQSAPGQSTPGQAPGQSASGQSSPGQSSPGRDKPSKPAPAATPDDPRLHEEPIDTDDDAENRPFSPDGRPIAGVDPEYR